MADLSPYRGRDVLKTSLSVRKAGDGLSKAMDVDPVELEPGSTVVVALECEVTQHVHKKLDDIEGFELVQVLRAGTATLIDNKAVDAAIRDMADRVQRAEDAKKGATRLPTDEELARQHELGEHADGLVDGCAQCGDEQAATDGEGRKAGAK